MTEQRCGAGHLRVSSFHIHTHQEDRQDIYIFGRGDKLSLGIGGVMDDPLLLQLSIWGNQYIKIFTSCTGSTIQEMENGDKKLKLNR